MPKAFLAAPQITNGRYWASLTTLDEWSESGVNVTLGFDDSGLPNDKSSRVHEGQIFLPNGSHAELANEQNGFPLNQIRRLVGLK